MSVRVKPFIMLTAVVLLVVLASGCRLAGLRAGELRTEAETVELGEAGAAEVAVRFGAGRLEIDGGADGLMDATFTYNVDRWKPVVDYEIGDGEGRLSVRQPETTGDVLRSLSEVRNEWELRFNEEVPLTLTVEMGAGEGILDLDDLTLNSFTFRGGAGDVAIDLSGGTVSDLDITMGAGQVILDLRGDWQQDLSATIQGGVGAVEVKLPAGTGVRVEVRGGLGEVQARGLSQSGSVYTNAAYGSSEVTLDIVVQGGIGSVMLEVEE
jgi:hypothetical protein